MRKLMDYICTELDAIEDKADRNGSLTMSEIQYADTLLHMKKNLLKSEAMEEETYGAYGARGRGSNARRDSRGRYADHSDMVDTIRDMMRDAPDDETRMEFKRFIDKIDRR